MKNRVAKCLLMGALAIGMTFVAIASEEQESASKDKQLCFQINGDINNSTQIDKIYLAVNSVGVATGNGCFYTTSNPSATPSCSPVIGNVNGKFPEVFLSLTGNWQRTIGPDVISEDTNVSVHYNFKQLRGEGIAKTLKTIGNAAPLEENSSEGSVSRIACAKTVANPIHIPPIPQRPITLNPAALSTPYTATTTPTPIPKATPTPTTRPTVTPIPIPKVTPTNSTPPPTTHAPTPSPTPISVICSGTPVSACSTNPQGSVAITSANCGSYYLNSTSKIQCTWNGSYCSDGGAFCN